MEKQHQSSRKILTALLVIFLISIVAGFFIWWSNLTSFPKISTTPSDITSTPQTSDLVTISQEVVKALSGEIAFIKDENLFIVSNSGIKQITKKGNVGEFKWSRDGRYIGWIDQGEFNYENQKSAWVREVGTSLSLLDITTGQISEVIQPKYSEDELYDEPYRRALSGFDFSNDSSKIVYIRDGVWLKDINGGYEEKIALNYLGDPDNAGDDRIYRDVEWNPKLDMILLYQTIWECGRTELYNLQTKQIEEVAIRTCNQGLWSMTGKDIIGYSQSGRDEGGLWGASVEDKSVKKIVDDEKYGISVRSVAFSSDNQILAIIEPPWLGSDTSLPFNGSAIYLVDDTGVLTLVKELANFSVSKEDFSKIKTATGLGLSSDGKQISFLYRKYDHNENEAEFDLLILNRDGSNLMTVLLDISSYRWAPYEKENYFNQSR